MSEPIHEDCIDEIEALERQLAEARVFRAELVELVDGDDSTLADQLRDLMLNLDEGILGEKGA